MFNDTLRTNDERALVRKEVAALEACACQGLHLGQAMTENTFVMEDMAAMLPLIPEFNEPEKELYNMLNAGIVRSMLPSVVTTQEKTRVIPFVSGHSIAVESFDAKRSDFSRGLGKVAATIADKVSRGYMWLTTHQSDIGGHLDRMKNRYKGSVRDTTVIIRGWEYKGKEVQNVEDAIEAAKNFQHDQLPRLFECCSHLLFAVGEAENIVNAALKQNIDENKIMSLYKAHTSQNIARIFGTDQYPILGGRVVGVIETNTRASTVNEKITAVTAVQVTFDRIGEEQTPHNTPSATEPEADEIMRVCTQILESVDVLDTKNPIVALRRSAEAFEKRVTKLEDMIRNMSSEAQDNQDEVNVQFLTDLARMLSLLRLQATNFSLSTYTSSTDIVEKLLSLVKIKE